MNKPNQEINRAGTDGVVVGSMAWRIVFLSAILSSWNVLEGLRQRLLRQGHPTFIIWRGFSEESSGIFEISVVPLPKMSIFKITFYPLLKQPRGPNPRFFERRPAT